MTRGVRHAVSDLNNSKLLCQKIAILEPQHYLQLLLRKNVLRCRKIQITSFLSYQQILLIVRRSFSNETHPVCYILTKTLSHNSRKMINSLSSDTSNWLTVEFSSSKRKVSSVGLSFISSATGFRTPVKGPNWVLLGMVFFAKTP